MFDIHTIIDGKVCVFLEKNVKLNHAQDICNQLEAKGYKEIPCEDCTYEGRSVIMCYGKHDAIMDVIVLITVRPLA